MQYTTEDRRGRTYTKSMKHRPWKNKSVKLKCLRSVNMKKPIKLKPPTKLFRVKPFRPGTIKSFAPISSNGNLCFNRNGQQLDTSTANDEIRTFSSNHSTEKNSPLENSLAFDGSIIPVDEAEPAMDPFTINKLIVKNQKRRLSIDWQPIDSILHASEPNQPETDLSMCECNKGNLCISNSNLSEQNQDSLLPIASTRSPSHTVSSIKDGEGKEIGEIVEQPEQVDQMQIGYRNRRCSVCHGTLSVYCLMSGVTPQKAPTERPARRLTIAEGNHPCAEDRPSSHEPLRVISAKGGYNRRGSVMDDSENEHNRQSYLSVPRAASRRPSTADLIVEKLQVERHEGGGLTISGVGLTAQCHLTLIICGSFFLLAGTILTYVAYASLGGPGGGTAGGLYNNTTEQQKSEDGNDIENTSNPESINNKNGGNSKKPLNKGQDQIKIIGPVCLGLGLFMLIIGISLFALSKKIQKADQERRRLQSEAQLDELHQSFSSARRTSSPLHTTAPTADQSYPILSLRRSSWWMDPTPVALPQTPMGLHSHASPAAPLSPTNSTPTESSTAVSSRATSPNTG